MKNQSTIVILIILLCLGATYSGLAQISIGGSLTYGSDIENIGLNANAVYPVNENIRVAGDVSYYFPKKYGSSDLTWWEINANGHYRLTQDSDLYVYGLAGLNYSVVSVKYEENSLFSGERDSEGDIGLNLGGGAEYGVGAIVTFTEMKYIIRNAQFAVAAGIRVPVN